MSCIFDGIQPRQRVEGVAVRVVDLADVRVGDDDERQQLQVHEPACEALWELALRLARRGEEEFSRGVEQCRAADLEHLLERQLLGGLEGVLWNGVVGGVWERGGEGQRRGWWGMEGGGGKE